MTARSADCHDRGGLAALAAADWLGLIAAPTFAAMALLTAVLDSATPAVLCMSGQGAGPLGGMAAMYVLMSAFHAAPWLRLIAARQGGAHRS